MVRRPTRTVAASEQSVASSTDELLLAALDRGGDTTKTGRYLMTFKEGAAEAGVKSLTAKRGLRVANARDFGSQAVDFTAAGDAHAVVFPEIGVALVAGEAAVEHGITAAEFVTADSPAHSVDPEYFMFATQINPGDYLRGVLRTAEMIYEDLGQGVAVAPGEITAAAAGATWGPHCLQGALEHF
jgi:hypothetical protein